MIDTFRAGPTIPSACAIQCAYHQKRSGSLTWKRSALVQEVNRRTGKRFSEYVFTIGFAGRATPYKRADFVLSDVDQLIAKAREIGPMQIVFAGKAHRRDEGGKDTMRRIVQRSRELAVGVEVVFCENYEAPPRGSTPQRPFEALGTSGMKAANNGVPSLSVLRLVDRRAHRGRNGLVDRTGVQRSRRLLRHEPGGC